MTLANRITLARIGLIPVFAALLSAYAPDRPMLRWAALGVFAVAALSDGIDGYIARHFNQRSKLGAMLDPLADKLLLDVAFVLLAVNRHFAQPIPLWLPLFMVARDAFLTLGASYLRHKHGDVDIHPRIAGKLSTALQMAAILAVFFDWHYVPGLVWAVFVFSLYTLGAYTYDGIEQNRRAKETHAQT